MRYLSRRLLHSVNDIFPPENITGHAGGDPVSEKKLDQGDVMWDVRKEILWWVFDGVSKCIEYPTNKKEKVLKEIKYSIRNKVGIKFKYIDNLTGKLRHASIGILAGKGLFSPFNEMIRIKPMRVHFHPKSELGRELSDWRDLICSVASRHTHCQEIVRGKADYIGFLDALGVDGSGGTWHIGASELKPTV